jgi:hypothetical protein
MCSPNGKIIDIFGPFPATWNDATITKRIIEHTDLTQHLQRKDLLIVDRGFRDAVNDMEREGYVVAMPVCSVHQGKQMSKYDANKSRIVTKVRYIVEVQNMRLKRFRSLERVGKNKSLGSLRADIRIVACLLNETLVLFEYEPGTESYVAATIKKRLNLENRLVKQVDERGLDRKRKVFETKDAATFNEFPSLTKEDLQDLTLGTYQLKQGITYSVEHITAKNRFEIEKYK